MSIPIGLAHEPVFNAVLPNAVVFTQPGELDDPWACTMFGFHLSRGIGIAPDVDLALKVLDKSCRFGATDPACRGARQLQEEIRKAIQAARP